MSDRNKRDEGPGQAAQERGERIETGKAIAHGGKSSGKVPGAEATVMPPAPPGESDRRSVEKTRAVSDALARLGDEADPEDLAEQVRVATGIDVGVEEVASIKSEIMKGLSSPTTPASAVADQESG
jgi:hypothetical protein